MFLSVTHIMKRTLQFLCLFFATSVQAEMSLLSSQEFVNKVLNNNLDIKLADAETELYHAKSWGLRLSPPTLAFNQMEMQGGQKSYGWSVSQKIPFPTKISSDYRARKYELNAKTHQASSIKNTVVAQARLIYFQIWKNQEEIKILAEKKSLLNKHIKLTKSLTRSNAFAQIHLLKVQSQKDQIDASLIQINQELKNNLALAAQMVDKNPLDFKFIATTPDLSVSPNLISIEKTNQIQSINSYIDYYKSLEKVAQSEWLPDFTLTYKHMNETMRFPENNEIMLGISIPFLYFWQPRAKANEGKVQSIKAKINLDKTQRNIEFQVANLNNEITSIKSQIQILKNKILPNSLQSQNLIKNIAPRDLSSLQEYLTAALSVPDVKLNILNLELKHEQAIAQLTEYIN